MKKQLLLMGLLTVGATGLLSGCNQAEYGKSQVREEPVVVEDDYIAPDMGTEQMERRSPMMLDDDGIKDSGASSTRDNAGTQRY